MAVGTHSSSAAIKPSEQVFTSASPGYLLLLFWMSSIFGRALTFLARHTGKQILLENPSSGLTRIMHLRTRARLCSSDTAQQIQPLSKKPLL